MNNYPRVSVILPSYNHAEYVEQAILSVISQSYPNVELIVIDDGSNDGSAELIFKLQQIHKFKFIAQENKGVYETISHALDMSTGKYISPFSSDDIYCKDKLHTLVAMLEQCPEAAVAYGRIALINSLGEQTKEIFEPYQSGNIFQSLLRGDFFINGLAALVRKDIYVSARNNASYVDDLPIWLSIAENYQFLYCNKVLAFYRRHENHLSGNLVKMLESEAAIIGHYSDRSGYGSAIKRWNLKWFYSCAASDKKRAIKYLFSSLNIENVCTIKFYWGLIRLAIFWKN